MIKNYFKVALRNIVRHKIYSAINIVGLGIGMTAFILIALLLQHEYSFDKFNKNYERIYRVQLQVFYDNHETEWTQSSYPIAEYLRSTFPEVEQSVVMQEVWGEYLSPSENVILKEDDGYYAEQSVLDIFTFKFIEGTADNSLSTPGQVILTKTLAEKLFPGQSALGKLIKSSKSKDMIVTGVIEDLPENSSLRASYFVAMSTLDRSVTWEYKTEWDAGSFRNYVLVKPNTNIAELNAKIKNLIEDRVENNNKYIYLKALKDVHLKATEEQTENSPLPYYASVAFFIMILACINFINLTTARAGLREKEIGIRKVVGGKRSALIIQFLSESIIISLMSMIVAFILVEFSLPYFSSFMQANLVLKYFDNYMFTLFVIGVFVVVGVISGLYPAIYLSSFKPVLVLKGKSSFTKSGKVSKGILRKVLVAVQFVISINLILSTLFINKQVEYMRNKDLGFNKSGLLRCYIQPNKNEGNITQFRSVLLSNPAIEEATLAVTVPFYSSWGRDIYKEGANENEKIEVRYNIADYDFINTMGMKITKGRYFSREYSTDDQACVINETLAKKLGWEDPIGKRIVDSDKKKTIIGVVKDFHPYSVHNLIPSYMLTLHPGDLGWGSNFVARYQPGKMIEATQFIKESFKAEFPGMFFEILPYDSNLDNESMAIWNAVKNTFSFFSFLAIIIALVGLLGLVSFTTQRKTKEIGIRKVLGAKISGLYLLITKEFMYLLFAGILLGSPGAYFVLTTSPGAYKCTIEPMDYIIPLSMIVIVTILTTMQQVLTVTSANPVTALKDE
jgi:putative ABC transport system permease protein